MRDDDNAGAFAGAIFVLALIVLSPIFWGALQCALGNEIPLWLGVCL